MENSSGMISNRFLELVSDWLIYKQFETLWRGRMGHGAITIDTKTYVIGGKTEGNT